MCLFILLAEVEPKKTDFALSIPFNHLPTQEAIDGTWEWDVERIPGPCQEEGNMGKACSCGLFELRLHF